MRFLRQTWTLTSKNFRIVLLRHTTPTVLRAFVFPIIITAFLSFARYLFLPDSKFGIGNPRPILDLRSALEEATREKVVFINNGFEGGLIDQAFDSLAEDVTAAGKTLERLSSDDELPSICRSSLRGVTKCYGAVIFWSSPEEGDGGIWNYTLRMDGALGRTIDTTSGSNEHQVYILALQHAVDKTITKLSATATANGSTTTTTTSALPDRINEYPFTSLTPKEREDRIRELYQSAVQDYLAIAFILGLIGIVYHMTGFIATEREIGISQLIEAMLPSRNTWTPQLSRYMSYHIAFDLLYLPATVMGAIILWRGIFPDTNAGIVVVYFILSLLALSSASILGAAFFKKSQLSGISVTIVTIALGILSQVMATNSTATVAVLSFFFTPCNFVYFIGYISRFQEKELAANLSKSAPDSQWELAGGIFWLFLVIQIIGYLVIGALVERSMYGAASKSRTVITGRENAAASLGENAVALDGFTKIYEPNFFTGMLGKRPVHAVDGLSFNAHRGQILALLGANGSGKSTTLDAIAGTNRVTSGSIRIDGTGGLGIAPQKNVLWDELTVEEHLRIFNQLKSPENVATDHEIRELVKTIDLEPKRKAFSKTLSGGQKRKLQLGMMLTGGSAVCCVDEVSSGLDPLSRRKIWDILLAERGNRTIILTTHFLDEADLLADQIVVLSKGTLRAEGSSVELKERLGGGYRIHVHNARAIRDSPNVEGVTKKVSFDVISYIAPSSALAAQVIKTLETQGINDYRFSGPTIEDVFLQLAEEAQTDASGGVLEKGPTSSEAAEKIVDDGGSVKEKEGLELLPGNRIGFLRQAGVLFLKRLVILKSNWFPYLAAFLIPIITAALVTLFVSNQDPVGCSPKDQSSDTDYSNLFDDLSDLDIAAGPQSSLSLQTLLTLFIPILGINASSLGSGDSGLNISNMFHLVDTYADFTNYVEDHRKNITPGGIWLGDDSTPPTLAWRGNGGIFTPGYALNGLDILLSNSSIATSVAIFDVPFAPSTGDSLQLLVYFALALSAFPGFFALYPNIERRRNVRGLQYSNGVRSLPLWLAYLTFDFAIMLVSMIVVVAVWAALSNVWYHVAYLFPVFILYGLASILLAYVISLFCGSQLSAYAFTAAGQGIVFLGYIIAYICVITYSPVENIDRDILLTHWTISVIAPIGSAARALFVSLNLFSTACKGEEVNPDPGSLLAFGGPILYLCLQTVILLLVLVWYDSGAGWAKGFFVRKRKDDDQEQEPVSDEEVAAELVRVTSSHSGAMTRGADGRTSIPGAIEGRGSDDETVRTGDGLRVVHLTKRFGKLTAVDNVTFGIQRGEVFALLGPNGAGKSTTISLIRGDIRPSRRGGGDVFVEDVSVTRHRAKARSHLGVCPQFDAVDSMTVVEHLRFYARVRGVSDVEHNVSAVLSAVGLENFKDRRANALSGGNKRKLSLGIALMGNPTVVLLDEPSSGLDAAAKRVMWRTLARVVPGRSILLTTHSMEEADALAGRAGILSRRMLAMGTAEGLRKRWGDLLYVHLVCRGAPRTEDSVVEGIKGWVMERFGQNEDVMIEDKTWHGQMRFAIPASRVLALDSDNNKAQSSSNQSAIGKLVVLLEEQKVALGVEHFSVSPTTLDQVFLNIVGRHNVREENYGDEEKKTSWWKFW